MYTNLMLFLKVPLVFVYLWIAKPDAHDRIHTYRATPPSPLSSWKLKARTHHIRLAIVSLQGLSNPITIWPRPLHKIIFHWPCGVSPVYRIHFLRPIDR